MYLSMAQLATRESVSVATISRIVREMRLSGNYPTAIRRAGRTLIDEEAFDHYVVRRPRKEQT